MLKAIEPPRSEVPDPMRALSGVVQDLADLLRQSLPRTCLAA